ncbi:MAG TPA: M20 family metallo-hydrolase [bacterium]|nr:M20 family metallo-hydrolase [bacterium]
MKLPQWFDQIDRSSSLVIEWQRAMTAIPAMGPESGGDGEKEKADWVKGLLQEIGYDALTDYPAPDPRVSCGWRPNFLVRWHGRDRSKTAWVMTHLDVVPPGDLKLWSSDPFTLTVAGDRLIGRGVEDNQQGLVSALLAVRSLREAGVTPACNIGLAVVADEENGSEFGLHYLLKHHRNAFGDQDLIIVPDAGDEKGLTIEIAEKSILWLQVQVQGKQCHASTPSQGINAHRAAAHLAVKLDSLYQTFNHSDALFDPPVSTFEPTKKECNVPNINSIPGEDIFYLDSRVLPHYSLQSVEDRIQELCREVEAQFGVTIALSSKQRAAAAPPTAADAPVVQALKRSIAAVKGSEAKMIGIGGGTVAAAFRAAGLPAAVWSTLEDTAHQPDESSLISNTLSDAKVLAHLFMG